MEVEIFDDLNDVIDLLTDKITCCVTIIVDSSLADGSVSLFDKLKQVHSIYLWTEEEAEILYNSEKSPKIKCVTPDLNVICQTIHMFQRKIVQNAAMPTFFSLGTTNDDSQSQIADEHFICCQLFNKMLLAAQVDPDGHKILVPYLTKISNGSGLSGNLIDNFDETYTPSSAIWWYTRESFLYQRLNQALRELNVTDIYHMMFFIQDLSRQIDYQYGIQKKLLKTSKITLYRGFTLSKMQYLELKRFTGSIITNSTFLSTSKSQGVAKVFASGGRNSHDTVGIILEFDFDSAEIDVPFADISNISFYPNEEECIFSIGTCFRVVHIGDVDPESMTARVRLKTSPADITLVNEKLEKFKSKIKSKSPLMSMIDILFLIGQPKKAFEFNNLLQRQKTVTNVLQHDQSQEKLETTDVSNDSSLQSDLFQILSEQLEKSTTDTKQIADIFEEIASVLLDDNQLDLAEQYYNAAKINRESSVDRDECALFNCYDKLGLVNYSLGRYSKAIDYYQKAMNGREKVYENSHLDIAKSCNHIGSVLHALNQYDEARKFYRKAIDIAQKLNAKPRDLVVYYNNIASVFDTEHDYANALAYYKRALKIVESMNTEEDQIFSAIHNNLGIVYKNIGEYSKALLHHQRALESRKKYFPHNKLELAASLNNLGLVHLLMGGYDFALKNFQETLGIQETILPEYHPHLALSYSNVGIAQLRLGNYDFALASFLKSAEIRENSYDLNLMETMKTYKFIEETYNELNDREKADFYLAKAQAIEKKILANEEQ